MKPGEKLTAGDIDLIRRARDAGRVQPGTRITAELLRRLREVDGS